MKENAMKLHIDLTRCEGHGLCQEAAPAILRLNDDDEPELLVDDIADHLPAARDAVRVCPVAALKLA
ncbi:ferredoxin [Microbacterium sp. NPDC077184]|uniref:ferredoxin n=1 Tax=Microbacterium sp. NPDC077184 TaxID=3154764 RepID=UPI0034426DE2